MSTMRYIRTSSSARDAAVTLTRAWAPSTPCSTGAGGGDLDRGGGFLLPLPLPLGFEEEEEEAEALASEGGLCFLCPGAPPLVAGALVSSTISTSSGM